MSFKGFFYSKLGQPFCSAEWNDFSNFGRRSPKEHFCEIILKSVHWSRRQCHLKVFSIFGSGSQTFQWSGTILAILVEGHPSNISVLKSVHWSVERF